MPFIGQQPLTGAYSKLDSITTSATATYNLQLGGAAYSPASANHLLVSLNGVMQAPQDSFTVSGSTITFASALTSSDNIDFIMALGDVLNIGVPSDGAVNTAQLANDAVTGAKIENNPTIAGNLTVSGTSTNTGLITASAGVAIGGTGAANTLDDYEEGTWTATLGGMSANPTVAAYSYQQGYYTKIGQQVFAHVYMRIEAGQISGGSGDGTILGLPFPASTRSNISNGTGAWIENYSYSSTSFSAGRSYFRPFMVAGENRMRINQLSFSNPQQATGWSLGQIDDAAFMFGGILVYMTDA